LFVRQLELAQTAALLARCDLFIGNDSGITHLAAALGVETLAIFGPSDPAQWRPKGRRAAVLSLNVECSPCDRSVMRSCPHRKCLNTLSEEAVLRFLESSSVRPQDQGTPP
jgi:ADP-heptose:LPS heptosyltransferase